VFPLGKSGTYKPLTFTVSSNGGNTFTGEYFASGWSFAGTDTYSTALIAGVKNNEYWDLTRVGGSTTGTVTLPYTPVANAWRTQANGTLDLTDCWYCNVVVVKREGTHWLPYNAAANMFYTSSPTETTNWATAGTTNLVSKVINSFSPFTFGVGINTILTLPINLLSFTGQLTGANGELSWAIADNKDLGSFDVEHSIDGRNYRIIGNVMPGATTAYKFIHVNLSDGVHYYRLNMKDKSGKTAYSRVVILQRNRNITIINGLKYTVVKNEAIVNIISAQSQMVNMTLLNTEGRIMWRQKAGLHQGANDVKLSALFVPQGMYFLQATTDDGVQATLKLMKE
jgi:hypothetical protein